jgi:hypothetical protein
MTGREANDIVGRIFRIHMGGLYIDVKVDDWKTAYGQDLFLVIPVKGSGSRWVVSDSLLSFR